METLGGGLFLMSEVSLGVGGLPAARRRGRGLNAISHAKRIRLKPFWQSSLLHELFNITSKEHAV